MLTRWPMLTFQSGSYNVTPTPMKTFTGKNRSRYNYLVQGHENPYYVPDEGNWTTGNAGMREVEHPLSWHRRSLTTEAVKRFIHISNNLLMFYISINVVFSKAHLRFLCHETQIILQHFKMKLFFALRCVLSSPSICGLCSGAKYFHF